MTGGERYAREAAGRAINSRGERHGLGCHRARPAEAPSTAVITGGCGKAKREGADEAQRSRRRATLEVHEEEEATARTETDGYRFPVGARRRELTEGLAEGKRAP